MSGEFVCEYEDIRADLIPVVAPSNGPSYSHADVCAASALLHTGPGTALDAIGIIPGFNDAVSGVQALSGIGSAAMSIFGNGLGDQSTAASGAFSGAGLGITLVSTLKTIGGSAGKAVPIVGNFVSLGATVNDIWGKGGMTEYYHDCMAGKN